MKLLTHQYTISVSQTPLYFASLYLKEIFSELLLKERYCKDCEESSIVVLLI